MAEFTIATTSDGLGNLKDLCMQYGVDRIVVQPDFATKAGQHFIITKGDKEIHLRLTEPTEESVNTAIAKAAAELREIT